ncbi:uncharacterized protein LOC127247420 [Andrographis paniculata]|uniref:uncharacterized protein LOC127247420 n=1 Tax=Andrographis paniculata TaxID=175694 RepID=UPI0021E91227|nr:uncharacterized protein LOC127247420 [Andrographis paniculata]
MEPEAVLALFDSLWFSPEILKHQSQTSSYSPLPEENSFPQLRRVRTRSKSVDILSLSSDNSTDFTSPDSLTIEPCLQTILSQKEFLPKTPRLKKQSTNKYRNKASSKSMSELEFEELKGFMDLGFVFSEKDRDDPNLVEIIPGLQRLGRPNCGEEEKKLPRPYLSEAWQQDNFHLPIPPPPPLMKWRVPELNSEIDMKDSLKWWAHTVASVVR